jgi:DNA-binding NarL/FixJ family response regulator
VADDHTLFREGLVRLLDMQPTIEVAVQAANGAELLEKISQQSVDVVLMDIDMPVMGGVAATRRIVEEGLDTKVIALSMHGNREFYFEMVAEGAKGFLLKSSELHEVVTAIESVCEGGSYFSQELLQMLVSQLRPANALGQEGEPLSERETEVLIEICRGYSNQEIADKLFISKRTVDKHRANILEKTGCRNTANLVYFAIKHKLIEI